MVIKHAEETKRKFHVAEQKYKTGKTKEKLL